LLKEIKMILQILKYTAGVATVLTGVASILWPMKVLGFTGLDVVGGRGITEIRSVLGAVFLGLGGAVLYFNLPETNQMLGATYLVMAVVRGISMIVDRSVVSSNVISLVVELAFGVILII
jgi:hypothetical protein